MKYIKRIDEAFIGPFVFNDKMSDEELKDMYDAALDGYANYQRGFEHPKSKYKQAYQAIEKILKKRGVSVDEAEEVNEGLLGQVRKEIGKTQTALKKKWKKTGGYENFGQDEISKIHDRYGYSSMVYGTPEQRKAAKLIDALDQWAMNYTGESVEFIDEATDVNDPVLVAFRATRRDLPKFTPAKAKSRRLSFDKYMDLLDQQTDIDQEIKDMAEEMAQTFRDMEQEAEPEGGEIADRYGIIMMKQEKEYAKLKAKKAKIDARIEKHRMS